MVPLSTSLSLFIVLRGRGLCGRFCFGRPFSLRDIVIIDVTLDAHQMLVSRIVDREIVSVLVFVLTVCCVSHARCSKPLAWLLLVVYCVCNHFSHYSFFSSLTDRIPC
jgi:hypothetical protein